MRTDALIAALAQDRTVGMAPMRRLGLELACGGVVMLLGFFLLLGPRPDLLQALQSPRFVLKPLLALGLLVSAAGLLGRLARPAAASGPWRRALLLVPGVLLLAVVVELWRLSPQLWMSRAVGHNALWCLTLIPLLAAAPLLCALHALRQAAPMRPALTGAVAGLLAGGLAAAVYALHCTDDSPLFVAVWYVLAVAIVTGIGALAGQRVLRW